MGLKAASTRREKDQRSPLAQEVFVVLHGIRDRNACYAAEMPEDLGNNSPALREWSLDNISFWPDYELSALGLIVMRDPLSGVVADKWRACEFDEGDTSHQAAAQRVWGEDWKEHIAARGYPWVRTRVMRRLEDAEPSMIASVNITLPNEARVNVQWLMPPDHAHDPELLYS